MPILDWRELQHAVEQKQKGKAVDPNNPAYKDVDDELTRAKKREEFEREQNAIDAAGIAGRYKRLAEGQDAYRQYVSDLVEEAAKEDYYGYGESRYDKRVPFETWVQDPVDYRANAQSAASKLINGIAKAVPYTATTFLDNTLGTALGLLGLGVDALDFQGDGVKASSFINNPFSEAMQSIREWSDENLPNYRTQAEVNDQDNWWKHINANFFGDTLMKNLGFTFGAMLSGVATSKLFKSIQPKAIREAYKAGVAASIGGDAAAQREFQKILQGAKMTNPKRIYDTFANMRDAYKRLDLTNQLIAGMGGAVGESRVEAISAAQEFRDEALQNLTEQRDQMKQTLISEIAGNDAYLSDEPVYDGYGNIVGYKKTVNDYGRKALKDGLEEIDRSFAEKSNAIDEQADNIAKRVFALNLPIVGAENALMFGRLFSGGYKTQARAKVRGSMAKGYRGMSKGEAIARSAGKAVSEGAEEILQKVASEGRKDIAMKNMASFYNGQYDEQAMQDVADSFMSMMFSAGDVFSSPASWQEFTVGLLTGAIVDPVTGGYSAMSKQREESAKAAEAMNKMVQDPRFHNIFLDLVRHKYLENRKDKDLEHKDQFAWHSDNDADIINDVMMWAHAGRLNDLEDLVDSISNISEKNIGKIKSDFIDETDSEFSKKSDAQLVEWLKDRGKEVKRALEQYRDFHEALDYGTLGTTDEKVIDELTFTSMQLQNFEDRYNRILNGVIAKVRPAIESVANEKDKDGNPTKRAEAASQVLSSEQNLRTLFGGLALDIEGRSLDSKPSKWALASRQIDDKIQEKTLKDLEDWGAFADDKITKQEVKDLQKLVRARQQFYSKLFDPTFRQSFEQEKKNEAEVVENLKKSAANDRATEIFTKLQQVNSLEEYFDAIQNLPQMDDETNDELLEMVASDPKLSKYSDDLKKAGNFIGSIKESVSTRSGAQTDGDTIRELNSILEELDLLNPGSALVNHPDAKSVEDAIVQTIMERTALLSDKATGILKNIIKEKLGDISRSDSAGDVKPNPQPKAEEKKEEKAEAPADSALQEQVLADTIRTAPTLNDSTLTQILKGNFSEYPLLNDEQKARISSLAQERMQELRAKEGMIVTEDSKKGREENEKTEEALPQDMPEKSVRHIAFVKRDTGAVRGMMFKGVYNQNELSNNRKVENEYRDARIRATMKWMKSHGVQQFMDSGALYSLYEYYASKGKQMPVYFLANPHLSEENPFAGKSEGSSMKDYGGVRANALLAVEINDEISSIIKSYEEAGLFDYNNTIVVDGTRYMVFGIVNNIEQKDVDSKPKEEKDAYQIMRNRSFDMEEAVRQSAYRQYEADKKNGIEFLPEGKWYIADIEGKGKLYTTLNYITPGWNYMRDKGDEGYVQIPLSESLGRKKGESKNSGNAGYRTVGKKYYFMLQTNSEKMYSDSEAPQMPMEIDAPAGSLWMATQRADGSWAWTYITIERTGETDFDAIKDTNLMKEVNKQIDIIYSDTNPANKTMACMALGRIFYLGAGNQFLWDSDSNGVKVNVGDSTRSCSNRAELLQALKDGNYRFQVSSDMFGKGVSVFEDLIQAGALTSEMRDFNRLGSMAGVNFLKFNYEVVNGNKRKIKDAKPEDSGMSIEINAIGRGDVTEQPGVISNIRIGDDGYRINPDGTVVKEGTGEVVNDGTVIAQARAVAEVYSNLKGGTISNYPGDMWIINEKGQYTELYERDVDGIKVRMHREGKNGAVMPMYDDARFESLTSVAKKQEKQQVAQETKPNTVEQPVAEQKTETKTKRKPRKSIDMSLLDKKSDAKTVQKATQEKEEKEDTIDCGI